MTKDRTFDPNTDCVSAATGMSDPYALNLDHSVFDAMYRAAISRDPQAIRSLLVTAAKHNTSRTMLADAYIPAVARKLGDMWCDDTMGFAEVTIGVARLQGLLRELGPEWRSEVQAPVDAPTILLATLKDAQHTLGAVMLAGQMRRAGFAVRLALDPAPARLADLVQRLHFDAIFISASHSENLEKVRQMIDSLRRANAITPHIVVGGGILENNTDVAKLVGADIATSNLDEAAHYCGLTLPNKSSATFARGT